MSLSIELAERGLVPEPLLRYGIRNLLRRRLKEEAVRHSDLGSARTQWLAHMQQSPIAPLPDRANEQHYEVPAELFAVMLGNRLKYSSGYWPEGVNTLDQAEEAMLALTAQRAQLADGQRVLELGCGWGSLSLWIARHYPASSIVAVSNSNSQREFIEARAVEQGVKNLTVITRDMNDLVLPQGSFDRVVSVEMFEHMRNWHRLLTRISQWLAVDGRVFIHVFAHRVYAYPFETAADDDWMGRHFFTGGMMPSADLLEHVDSPFSVEQRHEISGVHYARTAEAWHSNLVANAQRVQDLFARDLGESEAKRRYERWRLFFLACAELFGFQSGTQWVVAHTVLAPKRGGKHP
jgi:cyclopropane-fatty-acyl-phospholipid synthase